MIFTESALRPIQSSSRNVHLSVCLFVPSQSLFLRFLDLTQSYTHKPKTLASGGQKCLWSKIAFLILVLDDTIFKERGVCLGPFFEIFGSGTILLA